MGGYCFLSRNTVSSGLLASVTDHRMLVWCYSWDGRQLEFLHTTVATTIRLDTVLLSVQRTWSSHCRVYTYAYINRYRLYIIYPCLMHQFILKPKEQKKVLKKRKNYKCQAFLLGTQSKLSCGCLKYLEFAVSLFPKISHHEVAG